MDIFNVGDKVVIPEQYNNRVWYHTEIMTVLDVGYNGVLTVDYTFKDGYGHNNQIHEGYVKLVSNRKNRIEKLFNDETK